MRNVVVNARGVAAVVVCMTESGLILLPAACNVIILGVVTCEVAMLGAAVVGVGIVVVVKTVVV